MTVPDPTGRTADPAAPSSRSRRMRLLSGTVVVALGLGVGQVLSYSLNLVAARVLPPGEFGALGALLGVVIIANTAALALQTVAARRVALMPAGQRAGAAHTVAHVTLRAAWVVGAVLAVLSPLLNTLLDLGGLVAPLLVAVAMVGATAVGGQLGLAQGGQYFTRVGILYAVSAGGRAVGGIVGALTTHTLNGTLAGFAAGALLAWLVGHLLVADLERSSGAPVPGFVRETLHVGHALLALFLLTNIDVLLARVFLTPDESGAYAVGVLMSKVAFFLPQFVVVVAFPRMARSDDTRPTMLAAAATAVIGVCVTLGTALLPSLVVRILGGPRYVELAPEIWLFAALGATYALVQVLLYGRIASDDRRAVLAIWTTIAALTAVVAVWRHASVVEIVTTALGAAVLLALVGLAVTVRGRGVTAPAPSP